MHDLGDRHVALLAEHDPVEYAYKILGAVSTDDEQALVDQEVGNTGDLDRVRLESSPSPGVHVVS